MLTLIGLEMCWRQHQPALDAFVYGDEERGGADGDGGPPDAPRGRVGAARVAARVPGHRGYLTIDSFLRFV